MQNIINHQPTCLTLPVIACHPMIDPGRNQHAVRWPRMTAFQNRANGCIPNCFARVTACIVACLRLAMGVPHTAVKRYIFKHSVHACQRPKHPYVHTYRSGLPMSLLGRCMGLKLAGSQSSRHAHARQSCQNEARVVDIAIYTRCMHAKSMEARTHG